MRKYNNSLSKYNSVCHIKWRNPKQPCDMIFCDRAGLSWSFHYGWLSQPKCQPSKSCLLLDGFGCKKKAECSKFWRVSMDYYKLKISVPSIFVWVDASIRLCFFFISSRLDCFLYFRPWFCCTHSILPVYLRYTISILIKSVIYHIKRKKKIYLTGDLLYAWIYACGDM